MNSYQVPAKFFSPIKTTLDTINDSSVLCIVFPTEVPTYFLKIFFMLWVAFDYQHFHQTILIGISMLYCWTWVYSVKNDLSHSLPLFGIPKFINLLRRTVLITLVSLIISKVFVLNICICHAA